MLATSFIAWWFGVGWKLVATNVEKRLHKTLASFSVPTLARTLFSPWKRIVSAPGAGIAAHMRATGDNVISRLVGFTVRVFVLLAAVLSMALILLVGIFQIVLWPLVPFLIIVFIIIGLA